jgi:hypothetical protein
MAATALNTVTTTNTRDWIDRRPFPGEKKLLPLPDPHDVEQGTDGRWCGATRIAASIEVALRHSEEGGREERSERHVIGARTRAT